MSKLDDSDKDPSNTFLVANFYTKSKFDEDCLINLSIEKKVFQGQSAEGVPQMETKITGLIRLRAKSEGMALCVGEKCKLVR
mmetsp:Transcript_8365/g.13990  ORF Transcript_8365/g.13990 Transcript_8365/m.13990 type:complete len:82 (+) Transcript_8365:2907-3152(+)